MFSVTDFTDNVANIISADCWTRLRTRTAERSDTYPPDGVAGLAAIQMSDGLQKLSRRMY